MKIDRAALSHLGRRIRWAGKAEEFSSADADGFAKALGLSLADWHCAHRALREGSLDAAFALVPRLLPDLDLTLRLSRLELGWSCSVIVEPEETTSSVHPVSSLAVLDALCSVLLLLADRLFEDTPATACAFAPEPTLAKPNGQGWRAELAYRLACCRRELALVADRLRAGWYAARGRYLPRASRLLHRMAARLEERAQVVGSQ